MVGRRGPLQAAFTIKELREMTKLPNCSTLLSQQDFIGVEEQLNTLPRPRKRITELMLTTLKENKKQTSNYFIPKFYRSPLQFSGQGKVSSVLLGVNELKGGDLLKASAALTDVREELPCDLVVRSIGYKSIKVDDSLPFDHEKGTVVNKAGRVGEGLYATGWLGTGPTGVILTTMSNSFETANHICTELSKREIVSKPGFDGLKSKLKTSNVSRVTWDGWLKIDKYEQECGKPLGKPREKIVNVEKMLEIGGGSL